MAPLKRSEQGTSGPRVLLLHSSGMSSRQWAHLSARLSPSFRLALPDLIGHGANPPWPADAPFHWQRDVEALVPVLERLGEPAHVVGHSYGGLLALAVARARPALVRSLSLVEPVAFGVLRGTAIDLDRLAASQMPAGGPVLAPEQKEAWLTWFVDYWNGPGAFAGLNARMREAFLATAPVVYGEVTTLLQDTTPVADWARLTMPTLLIRGERSPVEAREVAAVLSRVMPHARLVDVAGAGHLSPLTHAEVVTGLIEAHLRASRVTPTCPRHERSRPARAIHSAVWRANRSTSAAYRSGENACGSVRVAEASQGASDWSLTSSEPSIESSDRSLGSSQGSISSA